MPFARERRPVVGVLGVVLVVAGVVGLFLPSTPPPPPPGLLLKGGGVQPPSKPVVLSC